MAKNLVAIAKREAIGSPECFALSYTSNRQQIRFWHFACNS
jgi:hypothetical protein